MKSSRAFRMAAALCAAALASCSGDGNAPDVVNVQGVYEETDVIPVPTCTAAEAVAELLARDHIMAQEPSVASGIRIRLRVDQTGDRVSLTPLALLSCEPSAGQC